MADIISREKAIETIQYRVCQGHGNKEHICKRGSCAYCGIMEIMSDISYIPDADVQPVDRWISCKDKMPEDGQDVITLSKDRVLNHAVYDAEKAVFRYGILIINPTHWIPLPPMPEAIRRDETCTVVK